VGASHRNAGVERGDRRNAYFTRGLGGGLAASLPSAVEAVIASDKSHHSVLDGHTHSAVANHPDGQFALNTAATSDHSVHANYETFRPTFRYWTDTIVDEEKGVAAQQPLLNSSGPTVSVSISKLDTQRRDRLFDQPELLVKPTASSSRVSSLLTREWSGHELMAGAVGLYAAYSVLAQA
tara:strand:- start:1215 stop:1754 length:540 start_codon:yes stop_codon:yes gene_type:complete